jgi:hypothetical protein
MLVLPFVSIKIHEPADTVVRNTFPFLEIMFDETLAFSLYTFLFRLVFYD